MALVAIGFEDAFRITDGGFGPTQDAIHHQDDITVFISTSQPKPSGSATSPKVFHPTGGETLTPSWCSYPHHGFFICNRFKTWSSLAAHLNAHH